MVGGAVSPAPICPGPELPAGVGPALERGQSCVQPPLLGSGPGGRTADHPGSGTWPVPWCRVSAVSGDREKKSPQAALRAQGEDSSR